MRGVKFLMLLKGSSWAARIALLLMILLLTASVLAEEAIKSAIADYYKRNGIDKEVEMPCDCHDCACGGHH